MAVGMVDSGAGEKHFSDGQSRGHHRDRSRPPVLDHHPHHLVQSMLAAEGAESIYAGGIGPLHHSAGKAKNSWPWSRAEVACTVRIVADAIRRHVAPEVE